MKWRPLRGRRLGNDFVSEMARRPGRFDFYLHLCHGIEPGGCSADRAFLMSGEVQSRNLPKFPVEQIDAANFKLRGSSIGRAVDVARESNFRETCVRLVEDTLHLANGDA